MRFAQGRESQRRGCLLGQDQERFQVCWTDGGGFKLHTLLSTTLAPTGHPIVVLIHGLNVSGRTILPTAELLAADFCVYVPDLPGCDESERARSIKEVLPVSQKGTLDVVALQLSNATRARGASVLALGVGRIAWARAT
jgi:pimeloyl-ACP methyl ester carboxylesterase